MIKTLEKKENMKQEILNNQNNQINIVNKFLVEQVSLQQLIDVAVDSANDHVGLEVRQELITRGKDNIQTRIQIKKTCKASIENLESVLRELNPETNSKEIIKAYKSRFLSLLSILDRIQLEWQKHDLKLKH